MKVCTDSCILGAYAQVDRAQNVLDIGTGTGLLALMAAQRSAARITAIEIDDQAAQQAKENFQSSPWANRIKVKNTSLQDFARENQENYDVILCNPPFYKQSFKSPDEARNVAMHSQELTFTEIVQFCSKSLATEGFLSILLPPQESFNFYQLASSANLYMQEQLQIFTKENGKHIRTIQVFGRSPVVNIPEQTLCIRQRDESYTTHFRDLLKEYYLIF